MEIHRHFNVGRTPRSRPTSDYNSEGIDAADYCLLDPKLDVKYGYKHRLSPGTSDSSDGTLEYLELFNDDLDE